MQTTTNTLTSDQVDAAKRADTSLVYRLEGKLADLYPIGVFAEGIRFHNDFAANIVAGPFAGGRVFGLDQFLLRPDGVGVIIAPEVIEKDDVRVAAELRGYVVPPAGLEMPSLDVLAQPGFEFPDLDFRVTASAIMRTAHPKYDYLNRAVVGIEGTVNLGTGRLAVESRVL